MNSLTRVGLLLGSLLLAPTAAIAQGPAAPASRADEAGVVHAGGHPLAFAWPPRVAPPGHSGAVGVIRTVEAPDGLAGFPVDQFRASIVTDKDKEDGAAVACDRAIAVEAEGCFLFGKAKPQQVKMGAKRPVAEEFFKFVSGEEGPGADGVPGPVKIQRTWFAVYEATSTDGGPRGVALVMPGLFNTPEPVIEYVITKLQKHGWAVVRMMAQPSRFTERRSFAIAPDHLEASATQVADVMQDRAAECAYSVRAAFEHVLEKHQDWGKLPRVAVGMSGGAMTLPTVVALEPEKYSASVIIAGGDDFFQIAVESNYRFVVDAMTFDWPSPPTPAQVDQFDRLYREKASLDSLNTASSLVGKPVLMIHGTHDGAVPAHLGDELWERLGKPERWSEEGGHEEIFMHLPRKADQICDWLAQKTGLKTPP